MPLRNRTLFLLAIFLFTNCMGFLRAQRLSNANATYQQLRNLFPSGEAFTVANLVLRRDAATFTFRHGSFAFYGAVNGKVTGAVFKGEGHIHLTPPTVEERHNLAILNKSEEFDEDFNEAVLRFTDGSMTELRKGSAGKDDLKESRITAAMEFRLFARLKLKENLDLRLLEDVLSPAPGGFFLAAIRGNKNAHLIFRVDPHGAPEVVPEEISLLRWSDYGATYLSAFLTATDAERDGGKRNEGNESCRIDNENLDISIEKNGFLTGLATVHLVAEQEGVAVMPLDLFPTLRVSRVETDKGEPLDFVQEKKDEDADLGVILASPLRKGETATIRIAYGGKDVVINEGGANYYPTARESWYPNASSGLGDYASYHMLFHVPKDLQLIATGDKVSEKTEGKITTSEWKTVAPLAVVGFSLGNFKSKEAKISYPQGGELTVNAYANTTPPDTFARLAGGVVGTLSTTSMLPVELSQGEADAQVYTNYFGPLPFSHVFLTQQYACNYGQSWPMLVYLPVCGFFDDTQRHFLLGSNWYDLYWKVVTPHEVAHQWWGQTVGFRSYRDQWMSEGFANESATIYLQATQQMDVFLEFWKQQRKLITEKNSMGFRPIDVGPVTMGFRLSNEKTGWNIYQDLVYPKGAYILHMIRMMMWTSKEGDERFKATMRDLAESYRMQAATTEDFKSVVEKHMSPTMDLDGNHRMDWFFNQYVYGMDLPNYHFESQTTPNGDGTSLHFKLSQSGVPSGFKMLVPVYLELTDKKVVLLGKITMNGNSTLEHTVPLPKLPSPLKRVSINYYYDVLATEN